jgi:splicing factor 1
MGISLPPPTPEELGLPSTNAASTTTTSSTEDGQPDGKKRKRSRWGSDSDRVSSANTTLPPGLTKEQEELYLAQLRVAELGSLIRSGYVPEQRSPEPEPVYNQQGQRLNTREVRYRQKHEQERHELVQKLVQADTSYRPPPDYKPPEVKIEDRISIPTKEYPDINFMGLIIGPRGKTLQQLERDTGAKVMIRGKASVKEGKGTMRCAAC